MEERYEGYQINDNFLPKKKRANMARLEKASSYAAKHGNEPQSKLTIGSKLDPLLIRSKKGKVDDDTDSDYLSDHSPISPLQTVAETERFRDPDVTIQPDNSGHDIRSDDCGCSRKRKSRPGEAVSSSNSWKIDHRQSARLAIAHGSNERDYSRFYWRNSMVASRNTDSDHEDVSYRFPRGHSRSTKYPSRNSFHAYMQKLREKMEHENENSITDARVCQVEAPKASSKETDREKDPEFFIRQKLTGRAKTRVAGPARAQVDQSEEDQFSCSEGVSRIVPNDLTTTVSSAAKHELTWRDWLLRSNEPALSNKCRFKHNRYFDLRTMRPKISKNKHRMSDFRNPTEVDYEPVVFGGGGDDDDEDDDEQINDAIFDCLDSSDNSKEKEKSPVVEGKSTPVTNSGPGVKSDRVSPVDENENRLEGKLGEQQTAKPSRSRLETNTTTKPAVKCSPMKPPRANLRANRHPRLTARAIAKRTPPTKPERQSLSKLPREDTSWASPKHALPSEAQGASQVTTVHHIRVDKWQEDWSPPRKFFIRPSLSEELLDKIEQEKAKREEKRKKMENLRRDFSLSRLSNEIEDISHEIAGIMGPQTIDQDNGEKKISETPKRVYPNLSLEKPREIERCSPKNLFSTAPTLTAKEAMEAKAKLNSSSKDKENRAKTSADARAVDSEPAAVPSSPNNNEKTAFSRLCSFNKSGSRAMSFIRNIPRLMSNRRRPNMESTWNNSTKRPAEFAESESVVDISTLTIQTQSPAASPEKSPTHERSIWRLSYLTPAARRKGPTKTPATDQPKSSNKTPRRMSLCRSWTMKFRKRSRRSVSDVERPEERIVDPDDLSPERSAAATELLQCADIELTRMYQASKALELCFSMPEFVGSRERVESERQLLVSGLRRKAFLDEVSALADQREREENEADCERAHLVISNLSLPLRESIERMGQGADQADWYVVVASHGRHLWASQAIECPRTGPRLHFPGSAEFFQLLPDFAVSIGVYRLQLRMPSLDHASKYHLPAKAKNPDRTIYCPSPSNLLSRNEKRRTIGPSSTKHADCGAPGMKQSSFLACGKLVLRLADLSKSPPWPLSGIYPGSPGSSVLQGSIDMTTKCKLHVQVEQSGFVNHGEELGGYTNWNRRWAVLDKRYLRFWNYPDEQYNNSHPLKEIDLADCTSESIGPIDRSLCARARTILLEIARARPNVAGDGIFLRSPNDYAIVRSVRNAPCHCPAIFASVLRIFTSFLRNLLSFDTPCELTEWQSKLNHVVSTLRAWNVK
uniref:PH domain-containing protein n=1 Tax=Trichogramma kaykai TaxID=54128 RepID=A0ABD2X0J5_9HYME